MKNKNERISKKYYINNKEYQKEFKKNTEKI